MMKALEIEDAAEVEGFLDSDDAALSKKAYSPSKSKAAKRSESAASDASNGSNNAVTRMVGILAALLLIILYLSGVQSPDGDEAKAADLHQVVHHQPMDGGGDVPLVTLAPKTVGEDMGEGTLPDEESTTPATTTTTTTEEEKTEQQQQEDAGDVVDAEDDMGETTTDTTNTTETETTTTIADEEGVTETTTTTDAEGTEETSTTTETETEAVPPAEESETAEQEETTDSSSSSLSFGPPFDYKPLLYSHMATFSPDPFHKEMTDDQKAELAEQWGKWHFWDGDEAQRPTGSICANYAPHCDIPGMEFPDTAWQVDGVFVNHYLDDGDKLISRAKEAIFTEYGHGKPLEPEQLTERYEMFKWTKVDDLSALSDAPDPFGKAKSSQRDIGGWTTKRSYDGLVRRLLHAMHTSDEFTVVLAGHSAAAGHGNHFHQSYMMQFHKIMAPIFGRLGVKLKTRNISQGGLGTLHNSLGFQDLYGDAIDVLIWDTGMTEPELVNIDIFYRQALLAGRKVPVLWGGPFALLKDLHELADVDVGDFGKGTRGIPETTAEVDQVPYAARYMKCPNELKDLCEPQKYCAVCWAPRDDLPKDPKELFPFIKDKPGSQVRWHPGMREHQLTGRVLAFAMLDALQSAVQIWSDGTMNGPPLDEDYWHIGAYYENIRNKVRNLPETASFCYQAVGVGLPKRICNTPMHGRGLHTPRFNPQHSALTAIVRPAADGYVPAITEKVLFDGPLHIDCFDVPDGEVDVYAIVSGRRRQLHETSIPLFHEAAASDFALQQQQQHHNSVPLHRNLQSDDIIPGKGWELIGELPGQCDGAYESICGRNWKNDCPALGHHDARGMLTGNEFSGWLVMDIPNLKEGLIILRIITWLNVEDNKRTEGWTSVNNEGRGRRLQRRLGQSNDEDSLLFTSNHTSSSLLENFETDYVSDDQGILDSRQLIAKLEDLPATFFFDYAINGKITSLSKDEFIALRKQPQRVVETLTLLDDPNFTDKEIPVEFAIRMRGCERLCTFGVPHLYWA